ncbi:MAG: GNAT family N-acetyltransferase [Alphaproteobacteria bacterium]|nr:GNAT family N-acetyltransferase [Alphaproteobacteria bacterium]
MDNKLSAEKCAVLHQAAFGAKGWQPDTFLTLLAKPTHFVLGDEACFILWQQVADEAEILTLAVCPTHQKQGWGYRVLCAALKEMKREKIKKVHLEVAANNRAARALYKKSGFCENGLRAGYYGDSDALLMVLCL